MQWKTRRYTDDHIQNELLQILALCHLHKIAAEIYEGGYCTLECDEVTDSSNKGQVIVCLTWVDAKHIHAQIYTNLGAAAQSAVGILYQMGQETHVVAKRIEKNWEGLFLVGWELVRRKHKSKMHAYYIFEISEEHKIIDT